MLIISTQNVLILEPYVFEAIRLSCEIIRKANLHLKDLLFDPKPPPIPTEDWLSNCNKISSLVKEIDSVSKALCLICTNGGY